MEVSLVWSIISRGDPPISSPALCPNSPDDDDDEEEQGEGGDPPIIRLEKLAWHVLDAIMLYGEQHRVMMGMSLIEDLFAMGEFYLNSKSEACSEIYINIHVTESVWHLN